MKVVSEWLVDVELKAIGRKGQPWCVFSRLGDDPELFSELTNEGGDGVLSRVDLPAGETQTSGWAIMLQLPNW